MGYLIFMTYPEQLAHPLWQKKRLDILKRDDFTCKICLDTETQLHIHHKEYHKGKKAWEYDNSFLDTYCKHCHKVAEEYKKMGFISLVASKFYSDIADAYCLHTVLISDDFKMVSVDLIYKDGTYVNQEVVSQSTIEKYSSLLQHAEKLLR